MIYLNRNIFEIDILEYVDLKRFQEFTQVSLQDEEILKEYLSINTLYTLSIFKQEDKNGNKLLGN